MSDNLSFLKKVPLREIWPHEAADFTPWLATEENITLLANAIGMELEVEDVERSVGPYSADIVARDATGGLVIIENQLEKTDHDHLGKCLTYASVLDAKNVVWIAREFTDEHKKAFDWLNDKTGVDVGFFAVRLELWRIDESKPAVRFNVVSHPAEIVKQGHQESTGELSPTRKLQLEWWTAVKNELISSKVISGGQRPRPRYWFDVALGRSGFGLSCIANVPSKKIGIRVYLSARRGGDAALEQLLESKEEIENEIGQKLEWNPNPEATDKVISLTYGADLSRKDKWAEYVTWMVEYIEKFKKTFAPRIKNLDLEIPELAEEED